MAKRRFTEASWRAHPWFRALVRAFLACRNEREVADFMRDVGTLSELQAWSERLEVARELERGVAYRDISGNTGASTTTVSRVARFLEDGTGGYRRVLQIMNTHHHHGTTARGEQAAVVRRKSKFRFR